MPNQNFISKINGDYPLNYPVFMSGKLTYKVKLKKDFIRKDGTCAVYLQLFLNGKKMLPLGFAVKTVDFDEKRQRVKNTHPYNKDYNLLIEKLLADINTIEVNYRLSGRIITLQNLLVELFNPTSRMDFITFWNDEMERQKDILKPGTYRQQKSVLEKIKKFKNPIYFNEINDELVQSLKSYCKNKLKNTNPTIATTLKSFKKYLHIAQKRGVKCDFDYSEIKNKSFKGNRTFLTQEEIVKLYKHWSQDYINTTHKNILSRFLFSCFTGLRIGDIQKIKQENFIDNFLVFTAEKTGKFTRIPLNESAKKFIDQELIFLENYTPEYINRELKNIAKIVGITKRITFHVSRHTFATNFLICGGRVEVLQKLLGHSKIEDTMIYVHIVENITNRQIHNLDDILS